MMRVDRISRTPEVPRYKKRRKKTTPKKADHKHKLEDVIIIYNNPYHKFSKAYGFVCGEEQLIGQRCMICGKINFWGIDMTNREEDLISKRPDLDVVKVEDIWHPNKEINNE